MFAVNENIKFPFELTNEILSHMTDLRRTIGRGRERDFLYWLFSVKGNHISVCLSICQLFLSIILFFWESVVTDIPVCTR